MTLQPTYRARAPETSGVIPVPGHHLDDAEQLEEMTSVEADDLASGNHVAPAAKRPSAPNHQRRCTCATG
jgi:hypothetical protein